MTRFYEATLTVVEAGDANWIARYFALVMAKRCFEDEMVLVGVDLYDIKRLGDTEIHRLVVACLPAGERRPTDVSAIHRIISPMLLSVMRREVVAA